MPASPESLAPVVRLVSSCAAVALLATALFFLLHHLGNRLPYDLAVERLNAESESDRPDEGHAKGYKPMFEYCEVSSAVLGGAREAREADEDGALRNAVVLKMLRWAYANWSACGKLEAPANAVAASILKTRYWWGGKALYAIALRWFSVYEIRELTKAATRAAYLLLAASLLLLSPKMLLLAAPLVVFGAFFSGIEYWADVANGLPYLWTVLFAAGVALATRRDAGREAERGRTDAWAGAAPVYCFAAGTVSSYLYMGDGHPFLAVAWIGMVVWFGCGGPSAAMRTRRAASCIVLYGAGIAVCYALGQVIKAMFLGEAVWLNFQDGLGDAAERSPPLLYLDSFYAAYWPGSWPLGVVPTFVAASALAVSLGLAVFEARRGRAGLLWGALWIVGLMAVFSTMFLLADDMHYRTARYVFVPLALCLSCLLLSLRTMRWRMSAAAVRRLSASLVGLLVVSGAVSWHFATFNSRAVDKVVESAENTRPIASSVFDVYLDEDRLVYVKEECGAEDVAAPFFLRLYPADVADLPYDRQPRGYANLNFSFERYGSRSGGRCVAVRPLPICIRPPCTVPDGRPPYEVVAIQTGQFLPGRNAPPPGTRAGRAWSERIGLDRPR